MSRADIVELCVDCGIQNATLNVRNRNLCSDCFVRYVNSKVLKRMESYRFRNLPDARRRRLLLPLSAGISSLVLLQILDDQLQRQIAKRNRTAYELVITHIVTPDLYEKAVAQAWLDEVSQRYPTHTFHPLIELHEVFGLDAKLEIDFVQHLGIRRRVGESNSDFLNRIFSLSKTMTTRADVLTVILRRAIVAFAAQQGCESVIWGHSDSRLAALVLSDVAKGRGGSVSSTIADGPSLYGVNLNYPLRELSKSEIQTYAEALPDWLVALDLRRQEPIQNNTSIRNMSIDDLLTNYINSQGERFPSIMANVVRTVNKLEMGIAKGTGVCTICALPARSAEFPTGVHDALCYGCTRMKQDIQP